MPRSDDPNVAPNWALLRDAQRQAADDKGDGLAVTIDIGNPGDIHPRNKQDVGRRLARVALRDTYAKTNVVAQGPTLKSATAGGDGTVTLSFAHADGLTLKGAAGQTFAVGGADGRFVWAEPKVEGDKVILSFDGVATPKTVRYAWQNNPPAPLYNAAGLPAVPFQAKVAEPLMPESAAEHDRHRNARDDEQENAAAGPQPPVSRRRAASDGPARHRPPASTPANSETPARCGPTSASPCPKPARPAPAPSRTFPAGSAR